MVEEYLLVERITRRIVKILQLCKCGREYLQYLRDKVRYHPLANYHLQFTHELRDFVITPADWSSFVTTPVDFRDDNFRQIVRSASKVATAARNCMADILNIEASRLHCSLKVLTEDANKDSPRVITFGRSDRFERNAEYGPEFAHNASNNSVFSSMLGIDDPKKKWNQQRCCFFSNDLPSETDFCCDRTDWSALYKCALCFPIRYRCEPHGDYRFIGFLTFDQNKISGFPDLPNIYKTDPGDYYEELSKFACFHVGAMMADTLAVALRHALPGGCDES